jgi:hypothetical protein
MNEDSVEPPGWVRYASNIAAGLLFALGVTLACLAWVDMFGYQNFLKSLESL